MSDRWARVDEAFVRALELEGRDRRALLRRYRATDPALADRVEALLDAADRSGDFLEEAVEEVYDADLKDLLTRSAADEPDLPDRSGERIGPWTLVERIGRGGMASVYLADRADGAWRQRVAIKILHPGLDTEAVVGRFMAERQILSSLDHPNIARFLGGGATDDGLPYLVMEYVDGRSILDHADAQGLTVDERLELFCDVARAVQAAHRQLVVHRDVKPSNVLVDGDGRVRLLDFGIASLLQGDDVTVTRFDRRVVTPAYATPEQLRGDPVTTASDVYQLGLLLCELVSGRRPYSVHALAPAAAERAVTEASPELPHALVDQEAAAARRTSAGQLRRKLRGDLDSIVLQAIEKEPEDRYPSVTAMVADVQRHLRGEVVEAQAASPLYRARKFIGRHRLGTALSTAALLVVVAASVLFSVQADGARRERDRAVAERERAERLTTFMSELFSVVDPASGGDSDPATRTLLAEGVRRARTTLAGEPSALADVLSRIGSIYVAMDLYAEATPLFVEAVRHRRAEGGAPDALVADLVRLGHTLRSVDPDSSARLLEEAVTLAEAELGPGHPRLAYALAELTDFGMDRGHRNLAAIDRALEIYRARPLQEVAEGLADALFVSARVEPDPTVQLRRLREALDVRRAVYGGDNPGTAAILSDMALRLETSDPVAADTLSREAAAMHERLYGTDHRTTLTLLNNHAGVLRDQGRYAEAEPIYRRVLRVRASSFPRDSIPRAYTLHGLGWVLAERGSQVEAEGLLREMLEILRDAGDGLDSWRYQMARNTLGRAIALQGRYAEAEPLLRGSYEWMRSQAPDDDHTLVRQRLIDLYRSWGRPDELAALEASG